ncbi:MAG: sugar nucleotide-binding protein [Nitrososphaerales archaeon]
MMHAAALTGVDKCEVDRDLAMKVNFEGTVNIAKAAKKNSFFIYVSTDYYFMVIKVSIVKMMILIL